MDEKFKVTREGLEKLKLKLILLKDEFQKNEKNMAIVCRNSSEDGLYGNLEFEEALRNRKMLISEIDSLSEIIRNSEIIKSFNLGDDLVNINDTIDINLMFSSDDQEELTIQLVGEEVNGLENKVSINSPLGKAIYGKNIGDRVSYNVNDNKIYVDILRKVKKLGK